MTLNENLELRLNVIEYLNKRLKEFGLQVDVKKYLSDNLSIPFEYIPEKIKGDVVKC